MASSVSFGFSRTATKSRVKEDAQKKFSTQAHDGISIDDEEDSTEQISSAQDLKGGTKQDKTLDKLVIPLIRRNEWRFEGRNGLSHPDRPSANNVAGKEEKDEGKEAAKQALLAEAKQFAEDREDFGEAKTIPLIFANKVPDGFETDDKLDPSLRPNEPEEEDYAAVPIEAFGLAVLRGMGWKEGDPIGKSNKKVVAAKIPELRPKGLGLGADKSLVAKIKTVGKKGDNNTKEDTSKIMKIGVHVKIVSGPNRESYGKIESFDEDNGRVIVRLAVGGAVATVSQMGIQIVTLKEYERDGKCINKAQYDKHKNKAAYPHSMEEDPLGVIELPHSKKSKKKKKEKRKRNNSGSDSPSKKRGVESVPWVRSDLRVRIVDKKYKEGKHYKEKVTTLDAASPDDCICRTDSGIILEGLRQSLLETVIPKSESAFVMIVRGGQRGEIGNIIQRDTKKCQAVVQLTRHQDLLETLDFDDISEYVGDTSAYE